MSGFFLDCDRWLLEVSREYASLPRECKCHPSCRFAYEVLSFFFLEEQKRDSESESPARARRQCHWQMSPGYRPAMNVLEVSKYCTLPSTFFLFAEQACTLAQL
jgi:hypothetical protein